jgi:signal transduction histidine kinase
MRREASAFSESELDRRLQVPGADDELARLGSTLNDLLARLEGAFRREGRFLDQASHELRTPLAVLKMELDLATVQASSPEEMREALRNAAAEADRLVRLAEDLLVLARVRGGRLPVRRIPVDLRELVVNTCIAYEARAADVGSMISWVATPEIVSVDPSRVRQALEDLLDNALRHGGGTSVEVSAERTEDAVRITVHDRGPGFPPAILTRATHPFERGVKDDAETSEGAGLGLAIVRAVAGAHGGSVALENLASGGALVTLVLRVPPEALLPATLDPMAAGR